MRRRFFLTGLGSGTLACLSGCSQSSSIGRTPEPADLQVNSVKVSATEFEIREKAELEFTVSNRGQAHGSGELWYKIGNYDSSSIIVDIPGGETESYSETLEIEAIGEYTIELDIRTAHIRNLDHTISIDVGPGRLDFGESWLTPEGYEISVRSPEIRDSYEAYNFGSGSIETYEPRRRDLFAFVPLNVENTGGDGSPPTPRNFFARVGSELREIALDPLAWDPDFGGDLAGEELHDRGDIPSGTAKSGYLVFEIDSGGESIFEVGWHSSSSPDQVVYWD